MGKRDTFGADLKVGSGRERKLQLLDCFKDYPAGFGLASFSDPAAPAPANAGVEVERACFCCPNAAFRGLDKAPAGERCQGPAVVVLCRAPAFGLGKRTESVFLTLGERSD